MQQGCCDEEGRAVQLMKPFLPAALLVLTRMEGTNRFENACLPIITNVPIVMIVMQMVTTRCPVLARCI